MFRTLGIARHRMIDAIATLRGPGLAELSMKTPSGAPASPDIPRGRVRATGTSRRVWYRTIVRVIAERLLIAMTTDWGGISSSKMGEVTIPKPKLTRPMSVAAKRTMNSATANSEPESTYNSPEGC